MLLFSEAFYNNDADLKKCLQQIFQDQKHYVSKIILDGIDAGIWDKNILVDNVSSIYMGIPVAMNMEMMLGGKNLQLDEYCNNMAQLLLKMLRK
jgi:hypothetical protein